MDLVLPDTKPVGFQECKAAIALPKESLIKFCNHWKVEEFYLFGSILSGDFHADSDVDTMISLSSDAEVGLFELVAMKRELETLFSRKVDLLTKDSIESSNNPIRRREILKTAKLIYYVGPLPWWSELTQKAACYQRLS